MKSCTENEYLKAIGAIKDCKSLCKLNGRSGPTEWVFFDQKGRAIAKEVIHQGGLREYFIKDDDGR